MMGVVMAGGRGSRMTDNVASPRDLPAQKACSIPHEKLMIKIGSAYAPADKITVIDHVIKSLAHADCIDMIVIVASGANAPATRAMLRESYPDDMEHHDIRVMDSDGAGYSRNLGDAIRATPYNGGALIVSGDMPYLDARIISAMCNRYAEKMWTNIVVSESYAKMLDVSLSYDISVNGTACRYTGVSLVDCNAFVSRDGDIPQRHVICDDHRIAFTLNTPGDYDKYAAASYR